MNRCHYLGYRSIGGQSLRYVATAGDEWVALLGWGSAALICEARDYVRHRCYGGLEMNEVLFPRNVIQKLKPYKQKYFWHRLNCSVMCYWSHRKFGHAYGYRSWFLARVMRIYGDEVVAKWLAESPLKIDLSKGGVM